MSEHAEFVRRVARAIVRDEHLAEDVAQETFVAATRSPPSHPGALRAWLGRVTRNFALKAVRRKERLLRREQAAARREGLESTVSRVERESMLRHVVEAVLTLDEPYRSTVMMRHFEGLSSEEIAARCGVTPSAVRTRLARAMERLRTRLDDVHDGDRAHWSAILLCTIGELPRAPLPVPIAPADAGTSSLELWSNAMTTGAKVGGAAVAAVTLLVGAAVLLWSDPFEVEESDGARGVAKSSLEPGQARREAGSSERGRSGTSSVEDSSATASAARASISGQVRFLAGDAPAPGVAVRLYAREGDEPLRTVQTSASGQFRIPAAAAAGPYRIAAANAEGPDPAVTGVALFPEQQLFVGTLWLAPPLGVSARVVDEAGQPIAGASVECHATRVCADARDFGPVPPPAVPAAETGEDGIVQLTALTPGTWTLRASHDGFAPGGVGGVRVLSASDGTPVRIVLERGAPVAGRVTRSDGTAASGVTVVAVPPRDGDAAYSAPPREILRAETITDEDGRYRFAALGRGTHAIGIASDGGSVARLWVIDVPAVQRFDIELADGGIHGIVTDEATGRGIQGAVVHAAAWRAHHPTHYVATTDAAGRYRLPLTIPSMIQGPAQTGGSGVLGVHFRAEKPGWVMVPDGVETQAQGVWVTGTEFAEWNVTLRRGATLSGVVHGPEGPLAGAEVTADVWHDLLGSRRSVVTSDADGRYTFPGLLAGRARVTARKRGYAQVPAVDGDWSSEPQPPAEVVVEIPEAGATQLDVTMDAGVSVNGRVTGADGHPISGALVTTLHAPHVFASTADDGRFTLRGLRPGTARIEVSRAGLGSARAELVVGGEEDDVLDVVLGAQAFVSGSVLGTSGGALPGAYVQVAPVEELENGSYILVGIWQRLEKHPVAPDGTFTVPVAVDGDTAAVRVRAAAPGRAPALSERVTADCGATTAGVALRLGDGHVLEGRVVAADGSGGVGGASVEFVNATLPLELCERRGDMFNPSGRPFEIMAVTDAEGGFRIEGLPAWNYELRVLADGYLGGHATARVPDADELTIEMRTGASIAGSVRAPDGSGIAGVQVFALTEDGRRASQGRTSPDGAFRLDGLTGSSYRLQIEAAAYAGANVLPETFDAVEVGRTDAELVAQPGAGTISGVCVAPNGALAAGVYVSAKPMTGGPVARTRTDTAGAFALTGLRDAPYALVAVCTRPPGGPETIDARCSLERLDVAVGTSGLRLEMIPTLSWAGRVVREDGEPLPNGTVIRLREAPASPWQHVGRLAPDGSFSFATVRNVPYEVSLTDPVTGQPLEIAGGALVTPSAGEARLVVPRSGAVSGVVVAADGRPVPHAAVIARLTDGATRRVVTDLEGRFQISGLGAGASCELTAASHAHGRADAIGIRSGDAGVRLTLTAADALTVRVRDAAGTPLRDALLHVCRDGELIAALRTDTEGRGRTVALPSGTYEIVRAETDDVLGTASTGGGETLLRAR